jgi:hypothetical protein
MLHETKGFLSSNFDMKDLGDASYFSGIEIYRHRSRGVLGLCQKSYIEKVLRRYYMEGYSTTPASIVKKVLRYLPDTKGCILTYRSSDNLEVVGYSDADFAGCVDTKKSTSSYIFTLAGGAISWKSSKQTLTRSSTMQASFWHVMSQPNRLFGLRTSSRI